ncbi:MAG: DUF4956 domain-containing protein [Lachnospiraceae bacterium]|nr:DUF4956 domain-containing protein [Lachnospiraceae bacterium]
MNFSDIFKRDFLASYTTEGGSVAHITAVLLITAVIAGYIFLVYRLITKKTFYSKNFNISLAAIAVITAGIILAVQSSIVISLGMVGALSIVRFRTAIKEPMDLCFLFWSIAVGICCGAHMTEIAVVLSLVLTVLVLILDRLPIGRAPMILVANLQDLEKEPLLMQKGSEFCKYYKVKSRNVTLGRCNLIVEVRALKEYEMMQALQKLEGVESVSLVSHDGEVTF